MRLPETVLTHELNYRPIRTAAGSSPSFQVNTTDAGGRIERRVSMLQTLHSKNRLPRCTACPCHDNALARTCHNRIGSGSIAADNLTGKPHRTLRIGCPTAECDAPGAICLFVPRHYDATRTEGDLWMPRKTLRLDPLSGREPATVEGHRIKQRECRLAIGARATNERWPQDVNAATRIDCHGRAILGTSVEHPSVLAHARRRRERATAITRHRERNIANVAG